MTASRISLVTVLLIVVAGSLFWQRNNAPVKAGALSPAPEEPDIPDERPPASLVETNSDRVTDSEALLPNPSARQALIAEPETASAGSSEPTEPPSTHLVRGRVTILERDGTENRDASGKFAFVMWSGKRGRQESVSFEKGEYSIALSNPDAIESLSVTALVRGGQKLQLEAPLDRIPLAEEIVILGRVPVSSTLQVLDAVTGIDLQGVRILNPNRSSRNGGLHPGSDYADDLVASQLASPITLDPYSAKLKREFLVGAEGYAWAKVEIDLLKGGDRRVLLPREVQLVVDVQGVEKQAQSFLRLRKDDSFRLAAELPLRENGLIEFTGLAPGSYKISGEIGKYWGTPHVLGSTEITLPEGSRDQVTLVLEPAPKTQKASMGGFVHVAKEWELDEVGLGVELLDTALDGFQKMQNIDAKSVQSLRQGYDSFEWSKPNMQTGRYELECRQIDRNTMQYLQPTLSIMIELPPEGRDDFEFIIPPPAELFVRIVEKTSGETIHSESVHWNPRRPDGVGGGSLQRAEYNSEREGYVIRAPETEIQLSLTLEGYRHYRELVDLRLGLREHTIRLERSCGVAMTLMDGEMPLPFPDDFWPELVPEQGEGHNTQSTFAKGVRTYIVSEPGIYLFDPPVLPGYVELPQQRVEIFAGKTTEHVMVLERE